MGCSVSSISHITLDKTRVTPNTDVINTNKLSTVWNITDEEKIIMKGSWHILKKDLTNNGLGIFLRIFKTAPKSKLLFGLKEDDKEADIKNMPKIRGHAVRFMQAIGAAIEHLDDLELVFTETLINLGEQHKHISGFVPDHFDLFYDAMMGQWTVVLNDAFNSVVLDAWSHLFVYILAKLKQGYLKPT